MLSGKGQTTFVVHEILQGLGLLSDYSQSKRGVGKLSKFFMYEFFRFRYLRNLIQKTSNR